MEYATRVIQFPLGIVGLAVSFAILPTLSRLTDQEDDRLDDYREALVFGLKLVLLLMLPALALLAALNRPLVEVLFERGAFGPQDTARTAAIFLAYSPMLPLTAVAFLLVNGFYPPPNARTPVLVRVGRAGIYSALPPGLIWPVGAVGPA